MLFYDKIELNHFLIKDRYVDSWETYLELEDEYGFLFMKEKNNITYKVLRQNMDQKEFLRLLYLTVHKMMKSCQENKSRSEELLRDTNELLVILEQEINQ